jgi:hypothetical protein
MHARRQTQRNWASGNGSSPVPRHAAELGGVAVAFLSACDCEAVSVSRHIKTLHLFLHAVASDRPIAIGGAAASCQASTYYDCDRVPAAQEYSCYELVGIQRRTRTGRLSGVCVPCMQIQRVE